MTLISFVFLGFRIPPTAVGGITTSLGEWGYRKDLNNPPTAVGGISLRRLDGLFVDSDLLTVILVLHYCEGITT